MPSVIANQLRLQMRDFGPRTAPPILLVQGLGMQLTDWPRTLLSVLAAEHRVILMDNRDYGRSQPCGPAIDPALTGADYPFAPVPREAAPYTLFDMAQDALGVLDALGIAQAHVLGFSLGGMVAQVLAALHPARVRSLTSLMSNGGQAIIPRSVPAAAALARMIVHVPDRATYIAQGVSAQRVWAGPHATIDARVSARHIALSQRRCYRPAAIHRQALAYAAAGERFDLLKRIACPTLILHGALDPVIPPTDALVAQKLIAGARFVLLPHAAHDVSRTVIDELLPQLRRLLAAAEAADSRPGSPPTRIAAAT